MGESEEESSSSSWRFSMELLSHVHTLRVFLFNSSPQLKHHQDCLCLEATLLSAPPTLSCTWKTAHQPSLYSLRLPLPLLLFDYFAPPRISALPDCIQLSLPLLPLPPFHLHAFSSLSLAHDGTHIPGIHLEAFHADNGIHGDNGSSHSSDGDKSHSHDDTHEIVHVASCTSNLRGRCHSDDAGEVHHDVGNIGDNFPKNAVHGADDVGHGEDDAHQSHEDDDTHAIEGFASPAEKSIHGDGNQNCKHAGAHNLAVNIRGCHHDCEREDGNNIHPVLQHAVNAYDNICSHELSAHRAYHKDDTEAHGTHEIRQDATTALKLPGCHNDGMSEVHADNCIHGDDVGVCADNDACKGHESDEVRHVASPVVDISGCHHHGMSEVDHDAMEAGEVIHRVCLHAVHTHNNICSHDPLTHDSSVCFQYHNHGIRACEHRTHFGDCSSSHNEDVASEGSLQYQHGRNVVDLPNNGSSLHSQHHDSTVLESSTHQGHNDQISEGAAIFHCKKCSVKVSKNPVRNLVQLPCFDWRDIVENWFGACCCSFGYKAEILSARFEKSLKLRPGKCLVGPSTFYVDFSDVTVETESVVLNTDSKIRQWSTLHFLALGNGFMVWENQQSKYFKWLPVYCTGCASLIGAYACKPADSGLLREGLHLFRCQIMAFNADGTVHDTCRYASYKELLAKELRLRTEENTSYRFLIRSISSQLPLLQLVVLSHDSLICTGKATAHMFEVGEHPIETTSLIGEVGLQRSMKVLFLDCSGFSANEIRSTERWVQDYDVETIFMLEEFVDILKRELVSNRMFSPAVCGLSQVFHGSFIHT